MAELDRRYGQVGAGARTRTAEYDEGLRSFFLGVYNYMAAGVAVTGIVAYALSMAVTNNPALFQTLYGSPLRWVIMFAPLAFVFLLSAMVNRLSPLATQAMFWAFAAIMGVSISWIFHVFTDTSIARIFFITAAMFGSISIWGYTTKQDLSGWGSFLIMGLIGIIIAAIVNIFIGSSALQFAVSVLAVLIFAGLTAYDTQRLKDIYYSVQGDAVALGKASIMGALNLYLDFINIFIHLLSLFGSRE
jgi:FtsH-binding integral membrane protein